MHPVFMTIVALMRFRNVFKICCVFFISIIYSPTCQTVVSDPSLWYLGLGPVIAIEEEHEEAVSEPQRLVEWQADNVI